MSMSRRYLAVLVVSAVLVLGIGSIVRIRLREDATPTPAPPSEAAMLQQLSQGGQLRHVASFVAEQVAAASAYVVYVPEHDASGVRWGRDTILTSDRRRPVVVLPDGGTPASAGDTMPVVLAPDTVRRDWLLVVARGPSPRPLSALALSGGRVPVRCGAFDVEAYVLAAPLEERLAGGGVFNVDGELLGMAVRCGERVLAVPASQVRALLATIRTLPDPDASPLGIAIAPIDSLARLAVGDSGVLVTAVRRDGAAARAGLRAGDVLTAVDGAPATAESAHALIERAAPADSHVVTRRRGEETSRVRMSMTSASGRAFGMELAATESGKGIGIESVRPGSAAAAAGLRTGDRLLRVGNVPLASVDDESRAVQAIELARQRGGHPTLVVFEREGIERAVLLSPTATVETVQ